MRKLGYIVAALGALAVAVPSMASAETVVIKRHYHGPYGARAEFRDHGWHHRWHRDWHRYHGDRVVIIKKHRY